MLKRSILLAIALALAHPATAADAPRSPTPASQRDVFEVTHGREGHRARLGLRVPARQSHAGHGAGRPHAHRRHGRLAVGALAGIAAYRGQRPGRLARRHAQPGLRERSPGLFLVRRTRRRRRRHGSSARPAGSLVAGERAGHLAPATEGRRRQSFRLAHRVPRRRHAVHHAGRSLHAIARKCRTSARRSARSCASTPTAPCRATIRSWSAPGARPEIWSYGHRNVQAATLHPQTRELWTIEHGARGGDELNNPQAGRNYGWPVITYGVDYSGVKIGEGTAKAGHGTARVLLGSGDRAVRRACSTPARRSPSGRATCSSAR